MHTFQNKEYFVEFVDIGGSQRYEHSRYVFYKDIDGKTKIRHPNQFQLLTGQCYQVLY